LILEATLLFEGIGLHDHHRELHFDVNMSYEVWHHVETNGNHPTFILGRYVFFNVFKGHGTNLWTLNIELLSILEVWFVNIELALWKKSELIVGIVKKKGTRII